MLRCDRVAPFGNPVVPDVYWMLIGSSGSSRRLARRELALADRTCPRPGNVHHSLSRTITARRSGTCRSHLGEHRDVVGLPEAARHHQQAHAGLAQRVLELGGLVGRVDRDEDRADSRGRELQDEPLVAVRRPDPDAVAPAHAVGDQRAGRQPDLLPELADRSRDSPGGGRPAPRGSAKRSAVRRRFAPIVSSSSGMSVGPRS